MKTVASIYQCDSGHNFIILDEDFENIEVADTSELECPHCGYPVASEMVRELEIKDVTYGS